MDTSNRDEWMCNKYNIIDFITLSQDIKIIVVSIYSLLSPSVSLTGLMFSESETDTFASPPAVVSPKPLSSNELYTAYECHLSPSYDEIRPQE